MSTKAMMAALKGKVLADLGVAHEEALRKAPKTQVVADTGKVDVEGERFDRRLAQDRAEGGGGFVVTANDLGDSFFAREQAEAKRNEVERARLAEESEFSVFHSSRVELEKQALEEERQALEASKSKVEWGTGTLPTKKSTQRISSVVIGGGGASPKRKGEPPSAAAASTEAKRLKTEEAQPVTKQESGTAAGIGGFLAGYGSGSDSSSSSDDD